jgi:CubicO group peptidase (beta-lactamase class C family)
MKSHIFKPFLLLCLSNLPVLFSRAQWADSLLVATMPQKLDRYLTASSEAYKLKGSVLIAQHGTILLEKGYGWRNIKNKVSNDSTSIFQIGSITKQFTAAIILRLQEEGKISVLDPLSKFYPDYPRGKEITIQNLLTHTSGIYEYMKDFHPYDFFLRKSRSKEEVIRIFRNKPLDFSPGEGYSYSDRSGFKHGIRSYFPPFFFISITIRFGPHNLVIVDNSNT